MIHNIRALFSEELIEAVGWTIVHSIWQGAIVAIALLLVLNLFKKYSAQLKYLIAYLALLVFLGWSVTSFISSYTYAHEKQQMKVNLVANPELITSFLKEEIKSQEKSELFERELSLKWIHFRALLQRNFPIVFTLWLGGLVFFLLRMGGSMVYIYRLRSRLTMPVDKYWQNKIREFGKRIGLKKKVEMFTSKMARVPMTIGALKPVILFPVKLYTGLSQEEIEAIIAHELAHIRRHDYLLNLLQSLIETLFFYHPGIWLISKIIRDEREHSCDELALELTNDRASYARALALSSELSMQLHPLLSLAFGAERGKLLQRVKRIKNYRNMKNNITEGFVAATLVFVSLVLLSFTFDSANLKKADLISDDTPIQEESLVTAIPSTNEVNPEHTVENDVHGESLNRKIVLVARDLDSVSEEMEQLIEIACTENDEELSLIVLKSMEEALAAVNMDSIMAQVDSAMSNIDMEAIIFDAEKLHADMRLELESLDIDKEALAEAMRSVEKIEMDTALIFKIEEDVRVTLEDIDIEGVVEDAMEAVKVAMESVDFEAISREALEQTREALQEMEIDFDQMQEDMNDARETIDEQLENLEEKMDELEED